MKEYKFPEVLSKLLADNNLSQNKLAREIEMSPFAINKWLKFGSTPSVFGLMALSERFDVSIDYLIYGDTK